MISQRRKVKIFFAVFAALAFLALTFIGLYGFYIPKKYALSVGAYAAEYGLDEDLVFAVIIFLRMADYFNIFSST